MPHQRHRLRLRRRTDHHPARHVETLEASTKARFDAAPGGDKLRRFKAFHDGAASWSRVERIVARVEAGPDGTDSRFVVTNLEDASARTIYQDVYCRRGRAENHIKAWKTHLAADRTSCSAATANQFRLFLHAGAYWLMWSLRALAPKRSTWRVAQFGTLRLRLIKIAARVVEMKTRIKVHLPSAAPCQEILGLILARLPRLAWISHLGGCIGASIQVKPILREQVRTLGRLLPDAHAV